MTSTFPSTTTESADGVLHGAPVLVHVVAQHVEELATLRVQRSRLVRSAEIDLPLLVRHDERIAAHLDGIAVAGDWGRRIAAMTPPGLVGEHAFAAAASALVTGDAGMLRDWLQRGATDAAVRRMVESAFGFVEQRHLRGVVALLLADDSPVVRAAGLLACARHGTDPGASLAQAFEVDAPALQARACDVAASAGRADLRPACLALLGSHDGAVRLAAARAACRLGDRGTSLDALRRIAESDGDGADRALDSLMAAASNDDAASLARRHIRTAAEAPPESPWHRRAVRAAALSGSPSFLPWLVERCAVATQARVAALAIVSISGADIASQARIAHADDDAASDPAADGPDEELPWPDADAVGAWWSAAGKRLADGRQRSFLGKPDGPVAWIDALRVATQVHRLHAAMRLAHAEPGRPMFDAAAPGRLQRARLDALVAGDRSS